MPLPGFHVLASFGVLAATTAKKTSSGSSFIFIFIIIAAGAYLFFIAPQRRKQRAQMAQQRTFEVGDEVVTTGGIYGRVEASDGERVTLDIADGVMIEVARTAIARRVEASAATALPDVATGEADGEDEEETSEDWEPPSGADIANTNGTGTNGTHTNGAATPGHGEWGDPWSVPPDGEKDAPGAGGSA